MEWSMPINEILREDITALNYTLVPPGYRSDAYGVRAVQERLARLVDALGEQAARAQGLKKVITSADKLRTSAGHILYLLKDAEARGGAGEAVGFLKVGRKHLFLFDHAGAARQLEPLCVLDFYVRAERQRRGLGRRLFDRMLRDAGLPAHMLAVDGPSPYMERFLRKNYGIACLARQSNNFAVAPGFFDATTPEATRSGGSMPAPKPAAMGRFGTSKPPSIVGRVIHGESGNTNHVNRAAEAAAGGETPARRSPERPEPPRAAPTAPPGPAAPPAPPAPAAPPAPPAPAARAARGRSNIMLHHSKLW